MNTNYLILPVILLTACGGASESTSAPTPAPKAETAPVVQTASTLTPMERGAKLYKRCKACHTLEDGGKHKVGPNLWAVYGSKAGAKEGFNYSKAMASSEIIWDETAIDAYMAKPAAYIKGNRMSFVGIKKQEDRDALQVYLKAETTP